MALRKPPATLDPALEITGSCKEWETYDCELVTPLYGGGVTAGEVDEEMPVRASAIRMVAPFLVAIAGKTSE